MLSNISIQSQQYVIKYVHTVKQYVIKYVHTVAAVCYHICPYSRSSMLSCRRRKTAMLSCVISTASCPNGVVTLTWQAEAASEHVIECSLGVCTLQIFTAPPSPATYTSTLSTLTIRNVSRVDFPSNMETRIISHKSQVNHIQKSPGESYLINLQDSQQGYLSTNLTSAATEVGSGPVYYTSECWVTVPVECAVLHHNESPRSLPQ
ncbi:hypothetical protein RRG08_059031 [Elysia crispata]|uniref:Uncharacterized protein n=1 Tax=Elysia crispata TaxID=231223 RepID=A0AAE1DZE9_9GAST|nr:hypothetical protein RRG08_059031 [Elysia crispata]